MYEALTRFRFYGAKRHQGRLTWLAIMAHARRAPCSDDAAPPPPADEDDPDDDDPAVEELDPPPEGDTTKRRKLFRWGMARCL